MPCVEARTARALRAKVIRITSLKYGLGGLSPCVPSRELSSEMYSRQKLCLHRPAPTHIRPAFSAPHWHTVSWKQLIFGIPKDQPARWAVGRVSTIECASHSDAPYLKRLLCVFGKPSAHRQTVRLPVRLACLNRSTCEKCKMSKHGKGRNGCDAAPVG
jgi:hypothetical protein